MARSVAIADTAVSIAPIPAGSALNIGVQGGDPSVFVIDTEDAGEVRSAYAVTAPAFVGSGAGLDLVDASSLGGHVAAYFAPLASPGFIGAASVSGTGPTLLTLTSTDAIGKQVFLVLTSQDNKSAIIYQRGGTGFGGFTGVNGFSIEVWGGSNPIGVFKNDQTVELADITGLTAAAVLKAGGAIALKNSTEPATPIGGGVIFANGGALKFKGTSGTVTTLAPA